MKEQMRVFDGHCDTILRCYETGGNMGSSDGHLDLERAAQYGGYAQFFALFGDQKTMGSMPRLLEQEYGIFCRELERNGDRVRLCRTGGQVLDALSGGKVAALLSVEGAELLSCSTQALEKAWHMGVRAVNLTWNYANALSGSNAEGRDQGLTTQGRDFVRKMEVLGMLVDVSHLSDPGFWDVAELSQRPFFASHSNSRRIFSHPRNLTDEMFTAIIEHNGVAGLNLYAAFLGERAGIDTVVAHLEHFLDLGGQANVALGGDWDGCSALPEGIRGIQDLDRLYERLLQRNYSTALLDALFFKNLMRVVSEVCTM